MSQENVYRPPFELISGFTYISSAAISLTLPLPMVNTLIVAGAFISMGTLRLYQAQRIRKYRKQVKVLPYYAMTANETPVSEIGMFLGKGFRWTQEHTQRLHSIRKPENRHLLEPSWLYKSARNHEIQCSGKSTLARFTRSNSWFNPVKPLPPVGGSPEIHGVEIHEDEIYNPIGERVGHTVVLGTTRVGKTRLAEMLVTQDIHRGDVTIFVDPKGDAEMLIKMYIEAQKANRPFFMFHLGYPEHSCRYNPIGDYGRITEVATRIANQLPSEGQSSAFRDFVWRFVNVLAKTMEALSIKPNYVALYNAATNIDELAGKYFVAILNKHALEHSDFVYGREENGDPIHNWKIAFQSFELDKSEQKNVEKTGRNIDTMKLSSFIKAKEIVSNTKDGNLFDALSGVLSNDKSYFEKLVSSLYPLLEKLTSGEVSKLISPDPTDLNDQRPIMDWRNVIESNAVVYVGLDALSDAEVAGAVGNSMFADLTSLAGQIYKFGHGVGQGNKTQKRVISLHADEFNELIGDEFIPMLNKAGGAGFQVTVYTQTWKDVEAKIGNEAKAGQIGGNLNTMIMLRVKTIETAEMLTNQLPDVQITNSTLVSGAGDVAHPDSYEDFTTRNEDRIGAETVPMLTPADLTQLPKGQAFALLNGGQLYKLRFPLPKTDPDDDIPDHINVLAEKMRSKSKLSQANTEQESVFTYGDKYVSRN